jgi:uncharacterized membrane protein YfcA
LNYPFEIELFVIGVAAGVLGTLVGLGGGFVVIPILRIVFDVSPAATAGASLVMVLANGVSGSLAYLRQGRADVKLALLVSITGIPACIAGALAVRYVSFASFDIVYSFMLIAFFIDIMRRRNKPAVTSRPRLPGLSERVLVDASGQEFRYAWNTPIVLLSGVAIGFIASFFGIGGGIVFLIVFIAVFGLPTHVVTATSLLAILLISPVGVAVHWFEGNIQLALAVPLALGGLLGGQFGPLIARRLSSPQLLTVLAFAVLGTALTLIGRHVHLP